VAASRDEEDGFVNGKRMIQVLAGAAALTMAANIPVTGQVTPAERPGIPASPKAVATAPAISREAQSWLADLVKINTSNPPGNEQIAAMYVAGVLAKEGIKAELLDLTPGRSAGGGALAEVGGGRAFEGTLAGGASGHRAGGQVALERRSLWRRG